MVLVAKPVIANCYWIVKLNNEKVGEVEAVNEGYSVKLHGNVSKYKTLNMIKQRASIQFESPTVKTKEKPAHEVHGFPTDGVAHNALYDIKHKLPVFTKNKNSKSWFAAGWYLVKQHSRWTREFCPKLITLQRYQFKGPFIKVDDAV